LRNIKKNHSNYSPERNPIARMFFKKYGVCKGMFFLMILLFVGVLIFYSGCFYLAYLVYLKYNLFFGFYLVYALCLLQSYMDLCAAYFNMTGIALFPINIIMKKMKFYQKK